MTVEPVEYAAVPGTDALALAAELPLTEDEAAYVEAARAPGRPLNSATSPTSAAGSRGHER